MQNDGLHWKADWAETRQHFIDWWNHDGLVLYMYGLPDQPDLHACLPHPGAAPDIEYFYTQPEWRARWNHYQLSRQPYPADTFPVALTNLGPGSLALYLGGAARLADETVWYLPSIDPANPESHPALRFDPENPWWQLTERTLRACRQLAQGQYLVGCPDLIENLDILAALRDPQLLLVDLLDRPAWVQERLWEINQAFFAAYDRAYEIIKLPDGSSCFGPFRLWGPGKTAKVQCDASAMISPRMFEKFVLPALSEQCAWLDHAMFHLDGHQCLRHLDLLLGIEALDAIEWTPDPQVPPGGDPHWYPLYRKILDAGKSVQAIGVRPVEVKPLLDAVGGKGLYIAAGVESLAQVDELLKTIQPFR